MRDRDRQKTETVRQEGVKKPRGRKIYWIFLGVWSILLTLTLAVGLIWFHGFLADYQKVYEETRPKLYQDEMMKLFSDCDVEKIMELAEPVQLDPLEGQEQFAEFLKEYMAGKTFAYGTKKGEHIEERPVYVVTADEVPFAVVRLKKQSETAAYGLPCWETDRIELMNLPTKQYHMLAPAAVTVTVNGFPVTEEGFLEEGGIRGSAADYLEPYKQISAYNRYNLGKFYGEPVISAVNAAGESVEVNYNEKEQCFEADFGGDADLRANVEDYVVQVVMDYAMYVSNDAPYNALDQYFPRGSELLAGIKRNQREWFDEHRKPEIRNQKMTAFTAYSDEAFSARVYLEQYMYVPYSGKTEMLVTDLDVYFVKIDGSWKVSGIAFK